MIGILFALIAATAWAISAIVARIGLPQVGTINATFFSLISSFIVLAIVSVAIDPRAIFAFPIIAIPWFIANGTLNFVFGRLFNYSSINYLGVARATPIMAIAPLISTGLAVVFFDEKITPLLLLGTASIIVGIIAIATDNS